MKTILIEDSNLSPMFCLLKEYYGDTVRIIPAFGVGKLIDELDKNKDIVQSDTCIVYFDLVPDNRRTLKEYNRLLRHLRRNNFTTVYVIPILCCEYIVCTYVLGGKFKDFVDITEYKGYVEGFEKYCKSILDNIECLRVSGSKNDPPTLKYYTSDCECADCSFDIKDVVMSKAYKYVHGLPCFHVLSTGDDINIKIVDLYDIHCRCIDRYNEYVDLLVKNGAILDSKSPNMKNSYAGYQKRFD